MMKTTLHSKKIYTPQGPIEGYLTIEDGTIRSITQTSNESAVEELGDAMILPGIIDLHSHGYRSWSAKTVDPQEIQGLSASLPSIGVTATLATITAWETEELHMLDAIATAIETGCPGAKILGIHMEGPFFNPDQHKATPRSEERLPDVKRTRRYIERARGHLRYMTIAPEMEGAFDVMDLLRSEGIHIGCGHTTATSAVFQEAKRHGMQSAIHTGNAMTQIDRREVALMGASLLDPDIYCEINCDLYHLSKEMLELMFRIKQDMGRFLMISDSDVLSGMPAGSYEAFGKIVHVHENGEILLDDGTINGSSKYVLYDMKLLRDVLHLPLEDIIRMSSLNPAIFLGMDDRIGSIAPGKDADLLVTTADLQLLRTYVNGAIRYQQGDPILENPHFQDVCPRIA